MPQDIAPFVDADPQQNLPLTATESLSLSPKMKVTANDNYNRNKNVIVFGPSGSGKSYSVAGPQLLQFNSNYVLSDPKGELLDTYGNVLLAQGYTVKVFNLKDRYKSDHYNLFAYIKNEDDILVVTKNLVQNLKDDPRAKTTADPIWEEGMTALLEALIGYVFYEEKPENRNMNSVMTLLLMLETSDSNPNSVSQLDLIFEDLSIRKPESFAAKQCTIFEDSIRSQLAAISDTVNAMGQNSGLLSTLTDWNGTLAGYAESISSGVVTPVALTLLALFMVLELYNATQRIAMNGSSNAYTIQQIALVMMKIVLCRWMVLHTTEILNALFEIAATVTRGISGYVGSGKVNAAPDIDAAVEALPGGIGNMPVALELMVVGWMLRIVNIVVNTIVAARFIELYVYNALASLSMATLCYQELHGVAVNFLKSYLAVALQGAVLYLVIGFYPALAASLGSGGSITEQAWAMLGQSVILLVAVFMSGKFTKTVTGAIA